MIPFGVIFGVPLRMHFAFPILVLASIWLGQGRPLLLMLVALTLHEAAHAAAARAVGQRLDSIELMPFGGVAHLDSALSLRPTQEIVIALAGPIMSMLLSVVVMASGLRGPFVLDFLRVNWVLALTNLLPALPLDGGRALRALLSDSMSRMRATKLFVTVGVGVGVLLLLLGVWAAVHGVVNPLLFLIGVYLIYAALKEKETLASACLEALHGREARLRREGTLPVRWIAVSNESPPERLATRLTAGTYHMFLMVDENMKRVSTIDEGEVLRRVLTLRVGAGE